MRNMKQHLHLLEKRAKINFVKIINKVLPDPAGNPKK